jgi:hypothetical protein
MDARLNAKHGRPPPEKVPSMAFCRPSRERALRLLSRRIETIMSNPATDERE